MKNRKKLVFYTIAIMIMIVLISSCGQAEFDVSLNIDDTDQIPLALLVSGTTVEAVIPVSSINLGIDIEKIIYDYNISAFGTGDLNITVKLSLYGINDDTITLRSFTDDSPPDWLDDTPNENIFTNVDDIRKGWVYLIPPTPINSSSPISATTTINSNDVINELLKQDTIWIVVDFTTSDMAAANNFFRISNQSIQTEGSKETGYYPGVF